MRRETVDLPVPDGPSMASRNPPSSRLSISASWEKSEFISVVILQILPAYSPTALYRLVSSERFSARTLPGFWSPSCTVWILVRTSA